MASVSPLCKTIHRVLLLSGLFWGVQLFAQFVPHFERFSKGLSQSTMNCIVEDEQVYIWIGTQDGLNRFDGHRFLHLRHDPLNT